MDIKEKLIYILFIIYPFGQLLRFGNFILVDCVVAVLGLWGIFKVNWLGKVLIGYLVLANIISYFIFDFYDLRGVLYLLRLFFYMFLYFSFWEFFKTKSKKFKNKFLDMFLVSLTFVAVFGWIQYFLYPDFRNFTVWGWDDHLSRLIGTFFDPGFTGILVVFGSLISIFKYFQTKSRKFILLSLFLAGTSLFTYSRASFLALLLGFLYVVYIEGKIRYVLVLVSLFFVGVMLLPGGVGEGVKLTRVSSIYARLENYKESKQFFLKSPIIGVGYNNLCGLKGNLETHSCYGVDSGFLYILVTTGSLGMVIFLAIVRRVWLTTSNDIYGKVFKGSLVALLVHGQFVNSWFYPFVMVYVVFLGSLSRSKGNG